MQLAAILTKQNQALPTYNCQKIILLPHIDYCCTVWGNISSNLTDCMIKLQKRTARIIVDKEIDTPSADMFAELNWMKFPDRVTYQKSRLDVQDF